MKLIGILVVVLGLIINQSITWAQRTSPGYQIEEDYLGPGGSIESNSNNYRTEGTAGDIGTGESSSTNYGTQSGFNTTDDPRLQFSVNSSAVNFGKLSTTVASTSTSTFSVLNYTAYGYVVQAIGNPPSTSGGDQLNPMTSTGPSQVGTEQFGINVVKNTDFCGIGCHLGADPVQDPDGTFSFGQAATNYNVDGNFRYVPGEVIASATKSSGKTDYTISYIANISKTTPAGVFTGQQTLVCTGTY